MVYKPLNPNLPNVKENARSKKLRDEKLANGERYEYEKSMYGNVHTIIDHQDKVYYRQDKPIIEQLDLLDEKLPRHCDYCNKDVDDIITVEYELVYEMIVKPKHDPEVKRNIQKVVFAACDDCFNKIDSFVPEVFKSGYLIEIRRDKQTIWQSGFLVCDGKIRKPWGAIQR